MEFQTIKSSVPGKRLRKVMKLAFYLIGKGFVSNRKLIMGMIVIIKKRRAISKSPSTLSFLRHSKYPIRVDHGLCEYEFSCDNSPIHSHGSKKKCLFFPCITLPKVLHDNIFELPRDAIFVPHPNTPEYKLNSHISTPDRNDKLSPSRSPFSVRISNYSNYASDDERDEAYGKVDHKAEEFIKRFYDQQRVQYQETVKIR